MSQEIIHVSGAQNMMSLLRKQKQESLSEVLLTFFSDIDFGNTLILG